MKNKNLSDYIIAAAVIGCSAVLLVALTIALTGWESKSGGKIILVDMPSVIGLRENSQVRYAGAHVGKVMSIKPLAWNERANPKYAVRIMVKITGPMPDLKEDSIASINSDTILAEKFLDISPGSPEARNLPPNQPLLCKDVASFDDLSRAGMNSLTRLNDILDKLQNDHSDLPAKISSMLDNADRLAKNADTLVKQLNIVLKEHENDMDQGIQDLRVVMQNMKVVSTYAKTLSGTLAHKPWRIVWGTTPNELPSEAEILKTDKPIPANMPKE